MGKMIESGGGKKKARKVTITIRILNFSLISVRQEYQEKWQGKNSHFLRRHSPIPIQVGFFETLSNQAVVLAAQTRFYLAQMLAQKGEVERSRSLHTEIRDQFQDWDISIWQQKCEQVLVGIKDLPFHQDRGRKY